MYYYILFSGVENFYNEGVLFDFLKNIFYVFQKVSEIKLMRSFFAM